MLIAGWCNIASKIASNIGLEYEIAAEKCTDISMSIFRKVSIKLYKLFKLSKNKTNKSGRTLR